MEKGFDPQNFSENQNRANIGKSLQKNDPKIDAKNVRRKTQNVSNFGHFFYLGSILGLVGDF